MEIFRSDARTAAEEGAMPRKRAHTNAQHTRAFSICLPACLLSPAPRPTSPHLPRFPGGLLSVGELSSPANKSSCAWA